jgi:nitrogen fixation protein FixH
VNVKTIQPWAYVPAGLLLAMLAGLLTLARIAKDDPGFSVEGDYYRKASTWDAEMAQRARNDQLGWQVELAANEHELEVTLRDRTGVAIQGARVQVDAFHNARAQQPRTLKLSATGDRYRAELGPARPGLWEFRLSAERGSERFTAVLRRDLGAAP